MGCVVVGLRLSDPIGPALIALGVLLPGLMLQDSLRFAFFATGRPRSALLNDVVWTVLLLMALAAVHQAGNRGDTVAVVLCLAAFGVTASVAAMVGLYQARVLPRPGRVTGWLREHRQLSFRYLLENVSASGATQIRSSVLGGVAGLASVGYMRGAEILMGPFLVVLSGVSQVSVPEASQGLSSELPAAAALLRGTRWSAGHGDPCLGGLPVAGIAAGGRVPAAQGCLGTGVTADRARDVLNVCAASFLTAVTAGLRATGAARRSLHAQLTNSSAYLLLGICRSDPVRRAGRMLGGRPGHKLGRSGQLAAPAGKLGQATIGQLGGDLNEWPDILSQRWRRSAVCGSAVADGCFPSASAYCSQQQPALGPRPSPLRAALGAESRLPRQPLRRVPAR